MTSISPFFLFLLFGHSARYNIPISFNFCSENRAIAIWKGKSNTAYVKRSQKFFISLMKDFAIAKGAATNEGKSINATIGLGSEPQKKKNRKPFLFLRAQTRCGPGERASAQCLNDLSLFVCICVRAWVREGEAVWL